MSYEQLSLKSFIKEMKEVTDGAHPRKFCFILGAGASRSSGIKSGQELVRIWDKELQERNEEEYHHWRQTLGITDENMSSFYSQYYEKRFFRCRADGYNYIEKIMESAKPSAGYVMLAHLLTQTPHNVVVTTNFDHLTEDAVNYYAQNTPLVIGHESLAHYVSGQPVRPTIIKIHRDLLFDPKSRSEDLEELPDSWKNALRLVLVNYHPVFIGYAGNDKSLMDFLRENSDKFANDEWKYPYWMLYKTDTLDGSVKDFLEKSKGFYIRHSGFDEVMIQIGAAFDYAIPTEDAFLKDAKKRYKALADAIDALSDDTKPVKTAEGVFDNIGKAPAASGNNEPDGDRSSVNQAIEKITSQSEIQRLYRDSAASFEEGQYRKAAELREQLVAQEPENARYHNGLGDALYYLDKKEEALAEYRKAVELDPSEGMYHLDLARALENLEKDDEALQVLLQATNLEPGNDWFHYMLATELEGMGQFADARAEYQKTISIDPNDAYNFHGMARVLLEIEQYEEALQCIQRAIELDPDYANLYGTMSKILLKLDCQEEAKAASQRATELKNKQEEESGLLSLL